jgi:ABC-type lipopolysaccharide export system ATPase subunit
MGKNAADVVFERVSKRYGSVTAVDAVSFRVDAGELVTLLGPRAAARRRHCAWSRASNRRATGAS